MLVDLQVVHDRPSRLIIDAVDLFLKIEIRIVKVPMLPGLLGLEHFICRYSTFFCFNVVVLEHVPPIDHLVALEEPLAFVHLCGRHRQLIFTVPLTVKHVVFILEEGPQASALCEVDKDILL